VGHSNLCNVNIGGGRSTKEREPTTGRIHRQTRSRLVGLESQKKKEPLPRSGRGHGKGLRRKKTIPRDYWESPRKNGSYQTLKKNQHSYAEKFRTEEEGMGERTKNDFPEPSRRKIIGEKIAKDSSCLHGKEKTGTPLFKHKAHNQRKTRTGVSERVWLRLVPIKGRPLQIIRKGWENQESCLSRRGKGAGPELKELGRALLVPPAQRKGGNNRSGDTTRLPVGGCSGISQQHTTD